LKKSKPQIPKKPKIKQPASDSDDDTPLAAKSKPTKPSPSIKKPSSPAAVPKKPAVKVKKEESDSDDDIPLSRPKPALKRAKPTSDSDDDVPLAAMKSKKPKPHPGANGVKKTSSAPSTPKKKRVKEEENLDVKPEDEDDEYKWWEAAQHDGTKKWTTLQHNGVLFPPPYEPLPKHVKMKYDGREVTLPPEAEEVAGFFAALIETDHGVNPVFQQNFFNDWLDVLKECKAVLPTPPQRFSRLTGGGLGSGD
jgi:DNA topoisomerase I